MKRFDFANEVAKQLITVSSAIITIVVVFYEKFFSHGGYTFALVFLVLFIFILSIMFGVLCIGGLTNLAEHQEYIDAQTAQTKIGATTTATADGETKADVKKDASSFIKLDKSCAQKFALIQQILFALGLLLFICTAVYDRSVHAKEASPPSSGDRSSRREQPIAWVQVHPDSEGADGLLLARAVVERGGECPGIAVGTKKLPMTPRTFPGDPDFPRTVCEASYPGEMTAAIGDITLPSRPSNPDRIVVMGDTGCRITHYSTQECNDNEKWPFARIAESAAKLKPQLIIHVGDYHYREKACADRAGCTNSPHGDNWATWKAEFFDPAGELLTAAPWIMLRGNHENCLRAGMGWQLLLHPERRIGNRECVGKTEAYRIDFRDLHMLVLDTADAESDHDRKQRVDDYQKEIRAVAARRSSNESGATKKNSWLLVHQPLWVSYGNCNEQEPVACVERDFFRSIEARPEIEGLRDELRSKLENPLDSYRKWFEASLPKEADSTEKLAAPDFSLVLSGDTHMFQMFAPARPKHQSIPLQLIVGMSGDVLEKEKNFAKVLGRSGSLASLFGVEGKLWARRDYGFALLIREKNIWTAVIYDVAGRARTRCNLATESCEDL